MRPELEASRVTTKAVALSGANDQTVSIRDAKARLGELAERAADGVDIVITRHGRTVARITAVQGARKRIDLPTLQALTRGIPRQRQTAARVLRRLRGRERC